MPVNYSKQRLLGSLLFGADFSYQKQMVCRDNSSFSRLLLNAIFALGKFSKIMAGNQSMARMERIENCNCCKSMLENLLATNLKMWLAKVKAGSKCYSSFEGIYDDTKLMNALFDCYGQLKFCRECVILYLNISPTTLKKMQDYVKNNPCPYRFRIKNKIRSAHYKLPAKRDFFDYIIKNRRPNTQYDKAGAPMFYLDNRFECIRLPSASDRQFIKKAEKSLVWHFNIEQLRHNRQTISSRTAHNWIKSEFPHTTLSPTQSWLCSDCKKLRKKEIARIKSNNNNKKNDDSPDPVVQLEQVQEQQNSNLQQTPVSNGYPLMIKEEVNDGNILSPYRHQELQQLQQPTQVNNNNNNCSLIIQHRIASNQAMDAYNSLCVQCQLSWAGIQQSLVLFQQQFEQIATDENVQDVAHIMKLGQMKDEYKATIDCDFQTSKSLPHYGFSRQLDENDHHQHTLQEATHRYALFNIKEHGLDQRHIYICGDDSESITHRCDYILSFLDDYIKYHLPTWIKNLVIITNRDNRSPTFINWFINLTKFGHFRFIQLVFTHPGHGGIATELMSMQFAHKFYGRDVQDVGDLAHLAKEFGIAHVLDGNGIYVWKQLLSSYGEGACNGFNYNDDVYYIYWKGEQTQVSHFSFANVNATQIDHYQHVPPVQHAASHSYAYLKRNMLLPTNTVSNNKKRKIALATDSEMSKRRTKVGHR
ncbi:hypothetical protein TrispH2_007163 [Trichoplax sp. H2]|nr:hypothetical protein TrispH2_007163 [Trichoplax sp. H2]|eukprot:RDD41748.1 hypothetical protein TrispH2_007163 [Trichoplax sp. H2]